MWAQGAEEKAAPTKVLIKVPVRRYKELAPADVYRAALEGVQADVRFRDAFAGRTLVPAALAQFSVGGTAYAAAAAFRTQGDLVCLVPTSSTEALRTLFGVPAEWPLTSAVLNGPMALVNGQQFTVEGRVFGVAGGDKCFAVESLLPAGQLAQPVQEEVRIWWPGQPKASVVSSPGPFEFTFPCTNVAGKGETVKGSVVVLTPDAVRDELAKAAAAREGQPGQSKLYGVFAAGEVYRRAADGVQANVDFTDYVSQAPGFNVDAGLASVPALRQGARVPVRTGFALRTAADLTCLVPADLPALIARAASGLPGEQVRIRGTVVGRVAGRSVVLVDYIGFPAQEQTAAGRQSWEVVLEWPDVPTKTFWDPGLYDVVDLPCRNAAGQFERVVVEIVEFRTVEMTLPPGAATPAAAGAPAAAGQ
jgi:hypothetical protein